MGTGPQEWTAHSERRQVVETMGKRVIDGALRS